MVGGQIPPDDISYLGLYFFPDSMSLSSCFFFEAFSIALLLISFKHFMNKAVYGIQIGIVWRKKP